MRRLNLIKQAWLTAWPGGSAAYAQIVLALILLATLAGLPGQLNFLRSSLKIIRLWSQPELQHRSLLGEVAPQTPAFDLLQLANARIPPSATVLLITPGQDVRHLDYTFFHRALYYLAPRPVWWLTPAPPDGTWESRWWISAPLMSAAIQKVAAEKGASYILAYGLPELGAQPDWARSGNKIAALGEGYILNIGDSPTRLAPQPELGSNQGGGQVVQPLDAQGLAPLGVIPAIATIFLLGYTLLEIVTRGGYRTAAIEGMALAWVLGCGVLSTAMLWLNAIGVDLGMQVAVLSIVSVAGFFGSKWSMRGPGRRVDGGGTLSEHQESGELDGRKRLVYICTGLLLIYLAWQILYVILMAMGQPLTVWDAWSSWGMKARTIFLEGHITQATYGDPSRASTLPYYPLFISLIEAWLYRWFGAPDDRWVGIIYLLFYLALGGVCYSAGRRYAGAGRLFSLSLAITVMAIPTMTGLAAFSFTDLPLAVVMTVAAVYLVAWLEQAQYPAPEVQYSAPGTLVLAALAAGWLPSIKREGMVLVALLCLAMVIVCGWKRQNLDRVGLGIGALVLATVLLSGPWWFFISTVGKVNSDFLQPNLEILPSLVGRLPIIGLMVLNILLSRDWAYIWPLVGLCAICLWFTGRLRSGPPRWGTGLILLVAYMYLGLMGLSYIFSVYTPYQAHVASSFYRLAAQVVPLPVLWLGYHRSW